MSNSSKTLFQEMQKLHEAGDKVSLQNSVLKDSIPETQTGPIEVTGQIKWFDPAKGYGFLTADDRPDDILVHLSVLKEIGITAVPEGTTLTVRATKGPKGWQAISISVIDLSTRGTSSEYAGEEGFDPLADIKDVGDFEEVTVQWFNRLRGFGFVATDEDNDGPDIFVHDRVLRRAGVGEVYPGLVFLARIGTGPRGPVAAEVKIP